MKIIDTTKSVWYERYKPACIDDLVIPQEIKSKLAKYVKTQDIPNIGLFSSNPGTGKSSTAHAIIKEIGGEALWINASMEKGIDVLRGKVGKFASQSSFDDNIKIVVMDEFDHFSKDGQAAFRGFIDEFSANCRFIFTGNYKEKIIQPLLDRLEVYDFNSFSKEEMVKPIFERLKFILGNENVQYDPKALVPIINTYYPRIRSMVGALQKFSKDGVFKVSESELDDVNVFDKVMQWVNPNSYTEMITEVNKLNGPDNMYTYLYNNAAKYFAPQHYPMHHFVKNVHIVKFRLRDFKYSVFGELLQSADH
jgi:DNA polymerase III delta prime subunit